MGGGITSGPPMISAQSLASRSMRRCAALKAGMVLWMAATTRSAIAWMEGAKSRVRATSVTARRLLQPRSHTSPSRPIPVTMDGRKSHFHCTSLSALLEVPPGRPAIGMHSGLPANVTGGTATNPRCTTPLAEDAALKRDWVST